MVLRGPSFRVLDSGFGVWGLGVYQSAAPTLSLTIEP